MSGKMPESLRRSLEKKNGTGTAQSRTYTAEEVYKMPSSLRKSLGIEFDDEEYESAIKKAETEQKLLETARRMELTGVQNMMFGSKRNPGIIKSPGGATALLPYANSDDIVGAMNSAIDNNGAALSVGDYNKAETERETFRKYAAVYGKSLPTQKKNESLKQSSGIDENMKQQRYISEAKNMSADELSDALENGYFEAAYLGGEIFTEEDSRRVKELQDRKYILELEEGQGYKTNYDNEYEGVVEELSALEKKKKNNELKVSPFMMEISRVYDEKKFGEQYGEQWYNAEGELPGIDTAKKILKEYAYRVYDKARDPHTKKMLSGYNELINDIEAGKYDDKPLYTENADGTYTILGVDISFAEGTKLTKEDLVRLGIMYDKEPGGGHYSNYYNKFIVPRKNQEYATETVKYYDELAKSENNAFKKTVGVVGGTVTSLGAKLAGTPEVLVNAAYDSFTKPDGYRSNPYKNGVYAWGHSAGAGAQRIVDVNAERTFGKTGAYIASSAYSIGTSVVDNVLTTALFGKAAPAVMAAKAGADTAFNAQLQGIKSGDVMKLAVASAAAEYLGEKVDIKMLEKSVKRALVTNDSMFKAMLKTAPLNMTSEFINESATEMMNIASEWLILENASEAARAIDDAYASGKYDSKVLAGASYIFQRVLEAGIAGAISGGILSGGSIASYYSNLAFKAGKPLGDVIKSEGEIDVLLLAAKGSKNKNTAEFAAELSDAVSKGKTASSKAVGALANMVRQDVATGDIVDGDKVAIMLKKIESNTVLKKEENISDNSNEKTTKNALMKKLTENIGELESMKPVYSLNGNEFSKGEKKLSEQVEIFFNSLGNVVKRPNFGSVILDKFGIKSSIAHGMGRAKAMTFSAVPSVIENGKQIDYQPDWKGRGYDTYVFAAPVQMNEKTVYVAAVVTKSHSDSRYYLHEVVDSDGNVIKITEGNASFKTVSDADNGLHGETLPSNISISQNGGAVNRKSKVTIPEGVLRGSDKAVGELADGADFVKNITDMALASEDVELQKIGRALSENSLSGDEYLETLGKAAKKLGVTGQQLVESLAQTFRERYENSPDRDGMYFGEYLRGELSARRKAGDEMGARAVELLMANERANFENDVRAGKVSETFGETENAEEYTDEDFEPFFDDYEEFDFGESVQEAESGATAVQSSENADISSDSLGRNGRRQFSRITEQYGTAKASEMASAFHTFYNGARNGLSFEQVKNASSAVVQNVPELVLRSAYFSGQNDARHEAEVQRKQEVREKRDKRKGKNVDNGNNSSYNNKKYAVLPRPNDGVEWTRGTVLKDEEIKQFYQDIADLKKQKFKFPKAGDGSYIFETENKFILTDGLWTKPTIRYVISFETDKNFVSYLKGEFYEELKAIRPLTAESSLEEACTIFGFVAGNGAINFRAIENSEKTYAGQNRRGKGTDSRKAYSRASGDRENRVNKNTDVRESKSAENDFYDINLEVAQEVPSIKNASLLNKKTATSDDKIITQKKALVNSNNMQKNEKNTDVQKGKSVEKKYAIVSLHDGKKYVQATEQVIKSENPDEWEDEIIDYVNNIVRGGTDVEITLDNGEVLKITERTAWKLGYRNTENGVPISDEIYFVKGNAAGVIDEIILASSLRNKKPLKKIRRDDFAKNGFEYRRAYFRDLDGKYYELKISVGLNDDGKEVYNIGDITKKEMPKFVTGSKTVNDSKVKTNKKASPNKIITQKNALVNSNNMQKNEKNTDVQRGQSVEKKFALTSENYSFSETVDRIEKDEYSRTHALVSEKTPMWFCGAGLKNRPMLITKHHIKTALGIVDKIHKNNENVHEHHLSDDTMKNLPKLLEKPVLIMDSLSRDDSIVAVLPDVDNLGAPIVVSISAEQNALYNNVSIIGNIVTSVYGKDNNFTQWVKRHIDSDNVLYYNKERAKTMTTSLGVQFPNVCSKLSSNTIIHKTRTKVKSNTTKKAVTGTTYVQEEHNRRKSVTASNIISPDNGIVNQKSENSENLQKSTDASKDVRLGFSSEKPNAAVENFAVRMNKGFKSSGLSIKTEVYYDSSEGAVRGEWIFDGESTVIRLNGALLRGATAASWTMSHELFHEGAKNDSELVGLTLAAFERCGMYDGSSFETYKAAYEAAHGKELSKEFIEEEIAADLMYRLFGSRELCEMFANKADTGLLSKLANFFRAFAQRLGISFDKSRAARYSGDMLEIAELFERAVKADNKKVSEVTDLSKTLTLREQKKASFQQKENQNNRDTTTAGGMSNKESAERQKSQLRSISDNIVARDNKSVNTNSMQDDKKGTIETKKALGGVVSKDALTNEETTDVAVKYALSKNQQLPFKTQVSICEDVSKWKKGEPLFVCGTSEYLEAADIDDLPIMMHVGTVQKAKRIQTLNQHGHSLENEVLFKIPELIKKPTLLFKSNSTDEYGIESRVIISNYYVVSPKTHQKCPLLIALHLNRKAGFQEVNLIASVYGKDADPRGYIAKQFIDGNLIGYSKKEANRLLHPMGLRLPGGNTAIDFDNIVSYTEQFVNTYSMQNEKKDAVETKKALGSVASKDALINEKMSDEDIQAVMEWLEESYSKDSAEYKLAKELTRLEKESRTVGKELAQIRRMYDVMTFKANAELVRVFAQRLSKKFGFDKHIPKLKTVQSELTGLYDVIERFISGEAVQVDVVSAARTVAEVVIESGKDSGVFTKADIDVLSESLAGNLIRSFLQLSGKAKVSVYSPEVLINKAFNADDLAAALGNLVDKAERIATDNEKTEISIGMSDEERQRILQSKEIPIKYFVAGNLSEFKNENGELDVEALKLARKGEAESILKKIAQKFGLYKEYYNQDIDVSFSFSGGRLHESIRKQNKHYDTIAELMTVFDDVVENAVAIEMHTERYENKDSNVDTVFVLAGAFENDSGIVPVRLTVKTFTDGNKPTLHVVVAANPVTSGIKKENRSLDTDALRNTSESTYARPVQKAGVLAQTPSEDNKSENTYTRPTSYISIADLFANVNISDGDLLKYIPDGFLSTEQKKAKNSELAKTGEYIAEKNEKKYNEAENKPSSGYNEDKLAVDDVNNNKAITARLENLIKKKEKAVADINEKLKRERAKTPYARVMEAFDTIFKEQVSKTEKAETKLSDYKAERREREQREKLLRTIRMLKSVKTSPDIRKHIDELVGNYDTLGISLSEEKRLDLSALRVQYEFNEKYDPDFIRDKDFEEELSRLDKRQLDTLPGYELAAVLEDALSLSHQVKNQKYILENGKRILKQVVVNDGVKAIENSAGTVYEKGLRKIAHNYNMYALNANMIFKKIFGYDTENKAYKLTQSIEEGEAKAQMLKYEFEKPFRKLIENREELKRFTGKKAKVYTFDVAGKQIRLTGAMKVSLFLQIKNDDFLRHACHGGLVIPDIELLAKGQTEDAYSRGEKIVFTPSQMKEITLSLTEYEAEWARVTEEFFNKVSKQHINDTSLLLYGYEIANVENYFPITTDKNHTVKGIRESKSEGTLENKGIFKKRDEKSEIPVRLDDVTSILERHIKDVADFAGLAVPIRNFDEVYKGIASNGTSFQEAISKKWGSKANDFIKRLFDDLQNPPENDKNPIVKIVNKTRGARASVVMTLNVPVTIGNFAAYFQAGSTLGKNAIVKAMKPDKSLDTSDDIIDKYTPMLALAREGNTIRELGDIRSQNSFSKNENAIIKFASEKMNIMQNMDIAVRRLIWRASEIYIRDNSPSLSVGSDEYYRAVAEIFNRTIRETQPNYSVYQRSQLLRSTSVLTKEVTMFKSALMQNYNIVYDAYFEYRAKVRAGNDDEKKKALERLLRVLGAQFAGQIFVVLSNFLIKAIFTDGNAYRDDDDKLTVGSAAKGVGKDFVSGITATVVGGDELFTILLAIADGIVSGFGGEFPVDITWYKSEGNVLSAIYSIGKKGFNTFDTVKRWKNGEVGINSARNEVYEFVVLVGEFFGMPIDNIVDTFTMPILNATELLGGNYGRYMKLKLMEDGFKTATLNDMCKIAFDAYAAGDMDIYKKIKSDMINSGYITNSKFVSKMKGLLKQAKLEAEIKAFKAEKKAFKTGKKSPGKVSDELITELYGDLINRAARLRYLRKDKQGADNIIAKINKDSGISKERLIRMVESKAKGLLK